MIIHHQYNNFRSSRSDIKLSRTKLFTRKKAKSVDRPVRLTCKNLLSIFYSKSLRLHLWIASKFFMSDISSQMLKNWAFSQLRICRPPPLLRSCQIFCDFYFSSYGWKCIESWGHFEYKNDNNSKKIIIAKSEVWFFFYFSRFRIFHVNFNIFEQNKIFVSKFWKHWTKNHFFLSDLNKKIRVFLFLLIPDIQIKILLIINK